MPPLEIKTQARSDRLHISLAGELDIVNAPRLDEELAGVQADVAKTVVLDLRSVTFIDSTGLRALIAADERAREGGGRLLIVRGAAAVDRAFEVTQLDQRLELVDEPAP
jgi:anti-anti-sigma factor